MLALAWSYLNCERQYVMTNRSVQYVHGIVSLGECLQGRIIPWELTPKRGATEKLINLICFTIPTRYKDRFRKDKIYTIFEFYNCMLIKNSFFLYGCWMEAF